MLHVRSGVSTDFWYDHWVDMKNRLVFSCTTATPPATIVVCDMVDSNENWNWSRFSSILPQGVLDRLAAIKPPSTVFGQDLPLMIKEDGFMDMLVDLGVVQCLWPAHDILLVAWDLGFRQLSCGCYPYDFSLTWTVSIRHITRDQNLVADRVVALCRDPSIGSRVFDLVLDALNDLVGKKLRVTECS
ncbi:hypothetical protein V6N11_046818 [Hibiscus sabdariffa]|uniref:RNase H type-1 domain-containing protein n=1 Tax=Hibiscus sabdariffa TaxID=183260 RepID=A0ABR2A0J0_9ROSI